MGMGLPENRHMADSSCWLRMESLFAMAGACSNRSAARGFRLGTKGFLMNFLLVFVGAGIGGMLRHAVGIASLKWVGSGFPFGTMFVNVVGSLLMGLVAEYWALKSGLPQSARLFITTGFMGGFTTFSTFSLDTTLLYERGQVWLAAGYAIASVVLSIGALFLGLSIIRAVVSLPG
jgi:fluoride exporter